MKTMFTFLMGLSLATAAFAVAHEGTRECHCKNCKCTAESHCGCYSEEGCACTAGARSADCPGGPRK